MSFMTGSDYGPTGTTNRPEYNLQEIVKAQADENKKSLEAFKNQLLEVLALFMGIFTLISIEVNLLKNTDGFEKFLIISLTLGGILLLFFSILIWVIREKEKKSLLIITFVVGIALIVGGGFLYKQTLDTPPEALKQLTDRLDTIEKQIENLDTND